MPRRSRAQAAAIAARMAAEQLRRGPIDVRGLNQPYAARQQRQLLAGDFTLTERAQALRPGVRWWWGERKVGDQHGAWCYLCGVMIVTWDTRYPMTQAASEAVLEHRDRTHGSNDPGRPAGGEHTLEVTP